MTVRKVLKDRAATTYLGGVLVSGFGDSAMTLVAGIWVKTLTGSDSLAAAVTFCVWAPTLVGPVLGTVADRVRRRVLLIRINVLLATLLPVLLAVRAGRDVWLVFAVFTVIGAASVLSDAAEAGIVTSAVPPDLRGDFNGLRMTVNEAMKLLAPLAGAGLFLRFGGGAVALLDAATFLLAAVAFAALRVREQAPAPVAGHWREQTAEGVRSLRSDPLLLRLVAAGAVAMFLSGISSAAIYAMTDSGLHRPPAFVAVLYAVQGSGSIVAGVVSGAVMRRLQERAFAALGLMLFTAGAALRAVPSLPVCLAGTLAIGIGLPWVIVAAFTAVQQRTDPALVGRVAAAAGTVVFAPTAVAAAVGAGMVALVDFRVQLTAVGVFGWLAAWLLLLRRPRTETGQRDAALPLGTDCKAEVGAAFETAAGSGSGIDSGADPLSASVLPPVPRRTAGGSRGEEGGAWATRIRAAVRVRPRGR
ncbi:Predicted arabinose efflux permease, MFS family [Actinacidiphila yanglinensis]|uniref:Predicted arabinose efflux permease, MFS family n=1 Tax=Actinacidiphila yanglinensis TaxID=310779 RepID=A0A1H6BDM6_9ACTN|nr:MFS transporter [Actinacidiphila yanglinensis]SEG58367.1 Predicted arabinose efflux permease, MFS family [Actinacidiphila yanglinensis]